MDFCKGAWFYYLTSNEILCSLKIKEFLLKHFQKIIVMSDIHLTSNGSKIIGLDPIKKFESALKHISHTHSDAIHLVLTGDLAHNGTVTEYEILKDMLVNINIPVTFMMGNHDCRKNFCKVFPFVKLDEFEFLQSALYFKEHALLCMDTLNSNHSIDTKHHGFLCERRLSWLENQLELVKGKKVILFMHHPPCPVGFKAMDKIRLINADEFFKILGKYKNIIHIIAGHIHRTISGNIRGYSFSIFKSTCHQMPLMFDSENVKLSSVEPSSYGILCLNDSGVIVHSEDYELVENNKKMFEKYN